MGSWIQEALQLLKQARITSSSSASCKVCKEQCNILRGTLAHVHSFFEQVQNVAVNVVGIEKNLVALREEVKCKINAGLKLLRAYEKDDWVITAILSEEGREDFKDVYSGLYDIVELASGFMLEAATTVREKSMICQAYSSALMRKTSVSMLELASVNDRKQMMRMGLSSEDAEEDSVLQLLCPMLLEKAAPLLDHNQLQFKQHLGQGGYGTVYEACWLGHIDVAVKVFSSGDSSFRRELAALASCKHPNILRIFGYTYDSDKQQHSLVMEKMDMDLADMILKAGMLTASNSIRILLEVAKGMDWLHSKEVIHRDLKPQNILVVETKDGFMDLRIADFGLSRTSFVTSRVSFATSNRGTRIYMAPEVWSSQHYSKKSDVFSFAMICYQLLTGKFPFQADVIESSDYMLRVSNGMRPLDEFPESCPAELAELTRQCWSGDVKERPSFAQIVDRLKVLKAKVITDAWDWNEVRKKLLASFSANNSSAAGAGRVNESHSRTRVNPDSLFRRSHTVPSHSTSTTRPKPASEHNKHSSTYPPASAPTSNKDELMKSVQKGKMTEAFQKAIALKDPDTLWWLASKVDSSLLGTFEERMVYSIAEQLSEVLGLDPVAIVDWLSKAIDVFTHNHRYNSRRLYRLLGKIAQGLHGLTAITPKDGDLAEFLRTSLTNTNVWLKRVEVQIQLYGAA